MRLNNCHMKTTNHCERKAEYQQRNRSTGWRVSSAWQRCADHRARHRLQSGGAPGALPRVSGTGSWAETALFASLGIIGVVAIIVAVVSGSVPAGSKEAPLAALEKLPMVHYVHSGRLIADARTAVAMVHYFFESDKPPGTNTSEPGPMLKRLAMPTNNAAGGPKA